MFASQIQMGYLDERIALARSNLHDQHQILSRLFDGTGQGTRQAEIAGASLNLDPHAEYHVVIAALGTPLADAEKPLRTANHPHVPHNHHGHPALLLAATGRWRTPDAVVTQLLGSVPCALGPTAAGLAGVAEVAAVALRLVTAAGGPPDGPITVRTGWRSLAFGELAEIEQPLRDLVRRPLAETADADMLIATVAAYLRTGTVVGAAEELYCHRNTVLNRMRRFEQLTELDLRLPADIALAALALLPGRQ